jgi:translation initiation factor 2 alpha subunit (eIF-2alpha)
MQPNNGLVIKSWKNDIYDSELKGLSEILIEIGKRDVKDVREVVKEIKRVCCEEILINSEGKYSKVDIKCIIDDINNSKGNINN